MNATIRRCAPGDEAGLALVGAATFLESYAHMLALSDILSHCASQHGAERYAAWLAKRDAPIWGAYLGDAPVGYVAVEAPDLPIQTTEADAEVRRIYVLSKFHGQHLGDKLMREALAWAKANGKRRALLGVNHLNERALAFYARQGFEKIGERTFQVGESRHRDFVLARVL